MKTALTALAVWAVLLFPAADPVFPQYPGGWSENYARTIEGEITGMKTFEIAVIDQPHLFARIGSDQREEPFKVDLGPQQVLKSLDLKEGDRITVGVVKGTVNDAPMWMATWIDTGEEHQPIRRPAARDLKSMKVRVLRTRSVSYEQADIPDQLFARVGMGEGEVTTVLNLGPVKNIPEDLQLEGRELFILARPAKIGDRMALIAEAFKPENGPLIEVDWNGGRGQILKEVE